MCELRCVCVYCMTLTQCSTGIIDDIERQKDQKGITIYGM